MQGNEFVWLASIILGVTLLGWLILDWLESAQGWDTYDADLERLEANSLGRSEQYTPDPMDVELELMLTYPLDPFAPALMWRPQPQDQWIEVQESASDPVVLDDESPLRPGEAGQAAS